MFWHILFVIGFILLVSVAYAGTQGAPWVPTWKRDLYRLSNGLNLKPGNKFIELGCGNARVCRHIKKTHPEADVVGLELSLLQFGVGWLQNRLSKSSVKIKLENAFKHNLSDYDAVYMFLMPETYEKIRQKLETELKPGSRVISYVWPIPGWNPARIDKIEGSPDIFFYQR